ncbi:MAG: ASCH domain-containing protein, partial [Verrucomicrobia bacterium]|nr:ASCH domain-containing protein [Verrucomicrobiota bacterium]
FFSELRQNKLTWVDQNYPNHLGSQIRVIGESCFQEVVNTADGLDPGESGDRSLAYWREAHRNYFGRQRFKDRVFDKRMPLVCERFRVVYLRALMNCRWRSCHGHRVRLLLS